MTTLIMFGNYSTESVKEISSERTDLSEKVIKKFNGRVKAGYALLGEVDLLLIVDFPNRKQAMKASVALNKLLGISFTTQPAVTFDEFDRLMEDV